MSNVIQLSRFDSRTPPAATALFIRRLFCRIKNMRPDIARINRHFIFARARASSTQQLITRASRYALALAFLLALTTVPVELLAATVIVTGGDGVAGSQGNPGETGMVAEAVAGPNDDATNLAAATGGDGGKGGSFSASSPDGASGGDGGNAIAISMSETVSATADVFAQANAGSGGSGGDPGGSGIHGAGGLGGNAAADSTATSVDGSIDISNRAVGGTGGGSQNFGASGRGGQATANATAAVTGDSQKILITNTAAGGDGGGIGHDFGSFNVVAANGGDGISVSTASAAGDTEIEIDSNAGGGDGGSIFGGASNGTQRSGSGSGGDGGTGRTTVSAVNAGPSEVDVEARVGGGTGGRAWGVGMRGGTGGTGEVLADGASTGGANVTVYALQSGGTGGAGSGGADGGQGGDSTIVDGATGSTDGLLRLTQTARAGAGGTARSGGTAGDGGNATSTLTSGNRGSGNVIASSNAQGGHGGDALSLSSFGGNGGDAFAEIDIVNDAEVEVSASASGGNGGDGSLPGLPGIGRVGRVYGESTTGSIVRVNARVGGGGGGGASSGSFGPAADGASITLFDSVDGFTTGELILSQHAQGGIGGSVSRTPQGNGGNGGHAFSSLTRAKNVGSLTVISTAQGGAYGIASGEGMDGVSGDTTAIASATNEGGSATASTGARGAFLSDAVAEATAKSINDGDAVKTSGVLSGPFEFQHDEINAIGGAGSDGSSTSTGIAEGNSEVTVADVALGGVGVRSNSAAVDGGDGGEGFSTAFGSNGGDASVAVSALGRGGNGGQGEDIAGNAGTGHATAYGESSGNGSVTVTVTQIGGDGGDGVVGGAGASAIIENAVGGRTSGTLVLRQIARGGEGGLSNRFGGEHGAVAGDALSTLSLIDDSSTILSATSEAFGGIGGAILNDRSANGAVSGAGGDAASDIELVGHKTVAATAAATGGSGGFTSSLPQAVGGIGGAATASAIGENDSTAEVTVMAISEGGQGGRGGGSSPGGRGGNGGASEASARGVSSGGGAVTVSAAQFGGNGGDGTVGGAGMSSTLIDAVSGSTTGDLTLIQHSRGGNGGGGSNSFSPGNVRAGLAGDAISVLSFTDVDAGTLTGFSEATGGNGGSSSGGNANGAVGGAALASISLIGAADVSATARALGGTGGNASNGIRGDGGAATLGTVWGESGGGGRVVVSGSVLGGSGASTNFTDAPAGNGADVALDNIVDGYTTHELHLIQSATGGAAGDSSRGADGASGNALSYLARHKTANALTVETQAIGGVSFIGLGAEANARSTASNTLGDVTALADASGGDGDVGGTGRAMADSRSTGNGIAAALSTARGGLARHPLFQIAGTGGDAISDAMATAEQQGDVNAQASAFGGAGLFNDSYGFGIASGGDAMSSASGVAQGGGVFDVRSEANGGDAVTRGGNGLASAIGNADAGGIVAAIATGGQGLTGGRAEANAITKGGASEVSAMAASNSSRAIRGWSAQVTGSNVIDIAARAIADSGDAAAPSGASPAPGPVDALATLTAHPPAAAFEHTLDSNPSVAAAFEAAGADYFLAYGVFDVASRSGNGDVTTYSLRADLSLDPQLVIGSSLRLGILDPFNVGNGFELARIRVVRETHALLDHEFTDAEMAIEFLDDTALNLESAYTDANGDDEFELALIFDVTFTQEQQGFGFDFLVASAAPVPLPAAAWLFALAATGLLFHRKQRTTRHNVCGPESWLRAIHRLRDGINR